MSSDSSNSLNNFYLINKGVNITKWELEFSKFLIDTKSPYKINNEDNKRFVGSFICFIDYDPNNNKNNSNVFKDESKARESLIKEVSKKYGNIVSVEESIIKKKLKNDYYPSDVLKLSLVLDLDLVQKRPIILYIKMGISLLIIIFAICIIIKPKMLI